MDTNRPIRDRFDRVRCPVMTREFNHGMIEPLALMMRRLPNGTDDQQRHEAGMRIGPGHRSRALSDQSLIGFTKNASGFNDAGGRELQER